MIYINDLSVETTTDLKLFADNTSFFSIVLNMNTSTINLNNNLNKIKNWAIQWKNNFDSNPSKQAQEVIFLRKLEKENHNQVYFNHHSFKQAPSQNHSGMYLDTKLNFQEHLRNVISKVSERFYKIPSELRGYFLRPNL